MNGGLVGAVVGEQFRIEREIDRGGMATVYLAHDEMHHRAVAVKVLHHNRVGDVATRRFQREVDIAASLTHPHVLPVYTSGEHQGAFFYVMPFVEGETLREKLKRETRLEIDEALQIVAEVADGLQYAHGEGIVHRDIKPGNIFLVRDHAVLADFGVAKLLGADKPLDLTLDDHSVGTPLYMGPEQALDGQADERSDLYSMGCVLYEMLVGEPPLTASTPLATVVRRQSEGVSTIRHLRSGVGPDVDELVRRSLQPDPVDRYASAAEMRAAILAARSSLAPKTDDTTQPRRSARGRSVGKRRRLIFGASVVVAALFVANFWPGGRSGTVDRIEAVAVLPFDDLSDSNGDPPFYAEGMAQGLRDALSRRGDVFVASRESSNAAVAQSTEVREVASRLGVDGVLEGSVTRVQGTVRINVRLTDTRTDRQAWGGSFVGEAEAIFALEASIVDSVVSAMGLEPQSAVPPRPSPRPTDVMTHNLYLRGQHAANDRTPEGLEEARAYFRAAIDRDSTFAPAWAGLASVHALTGVYEYRGWTDLRAEATTAVETAIRLDASLADAYTARGVLLDYQFRWDEAEQAYLEALDLNPNDARAHHWYAVSRVLAGRPDEAAGLIEEARHLNPLSITVAVAAGWVHYYRRDLETAINRLELALDLEPNAWVALLYLGLAYTDQSRFDDGIAAFERARELNPSAPSLLPSMARTYALRNEESRSRELLEEAQQEGASMYWLAIGYLTLGENEAALSWLQRAHEVDPSNVIEINTFWFDPLRDNPDFRDIVGEVHRTGSASS